METSQLTSHARSIRRRILSMVTKSKSSHVGTAFSPVEVLTALYFGNILRVDPPPFAQRGSRR